MNTHEMALNKHDTLEEIVSGIATLLGHQTERNVLYDNGEMDVLIDNKYYIECKNTYNSRNIIKSINQLERAIKNGMCEYGVLATYKGIYDVLKDGYKIK
jgi:hypothetical protein